MSHSRHAGVCDACVGRLLIKDAAKLYVIVPTPEAQARHAPVRRGTAVSQQEPARRSDAPERTVLGRTSRLSPSPRPSLQPGRGDDNTSQPTVSRQVKRLQDVVGSQLFISTPRGVRLTQKGEALARALSRLDYTLHTITSDLKSETREAEGSVRVSITDGLNALFAAPALVRFSPQYPKIQLHLKSPLNLMNLQENQTDMMIRFSERVIRHPVQKARPTSLHSGRREKTISEITGCRRTTIWNSIFSSSRSTTLRRLAVGQLAAGVPRGRLVHYCDNSFGTGCW